DLGGANLEGADLEGADLKWANLRDANLRDADLDYSCWPLSCKGLGCKIDDRIAIQLLYHTISNALYSEHVSPDVKSVLSTPELLALANRFHRVEECGTLKCPQE
ncbi:MAG: pentapeptide repeat-containing protein, partial [Oscillospiraceae bacterium]